MELPFLWGESGSIPRRFGNDIKPFGEIELDAVALLQGAIVDLVFL